MEPGRQVWFFFSLHLSLDLRAKFGERTPDLPDTTCIAFSFSLIPAFPAIVSSLKGVERDISPQEFFAKQKLRSKSKWVIDYS
jgi:hypothetical protein